MSLTEGIGVRLLSYVLIDDAKKVYITQSTSGQRVGPFSHHGSWPHVVNALIRHYIHDDLLQKASDAVVTAQQLDGESESTFSYRLQALARSCPDVFSDTELVANFVRGLRTSIRTRVQNMVRTLPISERANIHVVTSMAENEVRSQRAQAEAVMARSSRGSGGAGRAKQVTFLLGSGPGDDNASLSTDTTIDLDLASRTETVNPGKASLANLGDPSSVVDTVIQLYHIFALTASDVQTGTESLRQEGRDVMKETEQIPELTREQMQLVYHVIPEEYLLGLAVLDLSRGGSQQFNLPLPHGAAEVVLRVPVLYVPSRAESEHEGVVPAEDAKVLQQWSGSWSTSAERQLQPWWRQPVRSWWWSRRRLWSWRWRLWTRRRRRVWPWWRTYAPDANGSSPTSSHSFRPCSTRCTRSCSRSSSYQVVDRRSSRVITGIVLGRLGKRVGSSLDERGEIDPVEDRSPHDESTGNASNEVIPNPVANASTERKAASRTASVKSPSNLCDKDVRRDPSRVPKTWEERGRCRRGGSNDDGGDNTRCVLHNPPRSGTSCDLPCKRTSKKRRCSTFRNNKTSRGCPKRGCPRRAS